MIKYIIVTLFPYVAFNAILVINYKVVFGYKRAELDPQHIMIYGLIITIILYYNLKLIVESIKRESHYPKCIIVSGILGVTLLAILPFFPQLLNVFPKSVKNIYYYNISLNIAVAFNLITTYVMLYIMKDNNRPN